MYDQNEARDSKREAGALGSSLLKGGRGGKAPNMPKRKLSEAETRQRRDNGLGLVAKYGKGYFSELRKKGGGRPTFDAWVKQAKCREAALSASRQRPGRVSK